MITPVNSVAYMYRLTIFIYNVLKMTHIDTELPEFRNRVSPAYYLNIVMFTSFESLIRGANQVNAGRL